MRDINTLTPEELMSELSSLSGQTQQPSQPGLMTATGGSVGGVAYKDLGVVKQEADISQTAQLDSKRQQMGMEGAGNEAAGKVTLAQESLRNIKKIKAEMFPDGTAKSFNRGLAATSNLPGLRVPFFGRLVPPARPDNPLDPTDNEAAAKAQNVNRQMGTSLSGRQLIQTGVAARSDETQKLVEQFAPNMTSAGKAAFDGMTQLEEFYSDYLKNIDPQGAKGVNVQNNDISKLSDDELKKIAGIS